MTPVKQNVSLKNEAMIRALSYRKRDRRVTNVRQLFYATRNKALEVNDEQVFDLSYADYISYFRSLQESGLGKMIEGRHGKPTRFMWRYPSKSIVQVIEKNAEPQEFKPKAQPKQKQKELISKEDAARLIKILEGLVK